LLIQATTDDTRYASGGWGVEASQPISATRLTLTGPLPLTTTQLYTMTPADGAFDSSVEPVQLMLSLPLTPTARYYAVVESQDQAGNWGAPTAAFLTLPPPTKEPDEEEPRLRKLYLPLIGQ